MGFFQNFINFFHRSNGIVKQTNQVYKEVNLQDARLVSEQRAKRASIKVFNNIVENAVNLNDVLNSYSQFVLGESGEGFFSYKALQKEAKAIIENQLKAQEAIEKAQDRINKTQSQGTKAMLAASSGVDLEGDEIETGVEIIAKPARIFTAVKKREKAELVEEKRQELERRMIATKRAHFVMSTIDKLIETLTVKSKTKMSKAEKELFNLQIKELVEQVKIKLVEDCTAYPDITLSSVEGEFSAMLCNLVQAKNSSDNEDVGSKYVGLKASLTDKVDIELMEKMIDTRPQVFIAKLNEFFEEEQQAIAQCHLPKLVNLIKLYNTSVEVIKNQIAQRDALIEENKQADANVKKTAEKIKLTERAFEAVSKSDLATIIDTNIPAFYFRDGVWRGITLANDNDKRGKRDKKYNKQLIQSKYTISKAVQEAMQFSEQEKLALAQKLVTAYKKGQNLEEVVLQQHPALTYQELCERLVQRKDFEGKPEFYIIEPLTENISKKGKSAKETKIVKEGKLITAGQLDLIKQYYSTLPQSQETAFENIDNATLHLLYEEVSREASTYPAGKNSHKQYASFASDEATIEYVRKAVEENDLATEVRKLDLRSHAKDFVENELESAKQAHEQTVLTQTQLQQALQQKIESIEFAIIIQNDMGEVINLHKKQIVEQTHKSNDELGNDTKKSLGAAIKPLQEIVAFECNSETVTQADLDSMPIALTDKQLQDISEFKIKDRNIEVDITGRPSKAGVMTVKRHATTNFQGKAVDIASNMKDIINSVLDLTSTYSTSSPKKLSKKGKTTKNTAKKSNISANQNLTESEKSNKSKTSLKNTEQGLEN